MVAIRTATSGAGTSFSRVEPNAFQSSNATIVNHPTMAAQS